VSKVFTPESEGDDEDDLDISPPQPPGTHNYITPGGHARLKTELDFLLRTDRPSVVDTVHWAALNGDRSENGDYIYGKRRLREIDRRIRFLTQRLDKAEIVDPARQSSSDQVFFGASVTIREELGGEQTYQIVGVDETDLARSRISWVSPLARALIKARAGDSVRFQSPQGWREVEIVLVEYRAIDP
jgi:transcription elongation factor GreB